MSCETSNQPHLHVAHNSWPGYEPLPLAELKNLYSGVKVITYRVGSATEVIRAFEQDVVEVAAVTLDEAIMLQSRSKERIHIIVVLDTSHGGDAIIAKKEIASISDLKGKRIGLESSALGAFFISRAIDSAPDISLEQLVIVPTLSDQHFSLFMSGKIDAIVTFEPIKSMILENKGHVIFDSTAIENEIVDVLITKQSSVEKRPKEIKALVEGYFKALEFIKKYPDESLSKMAEFENVSVPSFSKSLSGIRIPNETENHVLLSGENP
ncbi:MAG: ABC transporter substrate-binding protein, partial [Gammaproteobacteria bacterium]|nr:ABC transporter substrate-binding protein [Gammaproteobacteria bacterium]